MGYITSNGWKSPPKLPAQCNRSDFVHHYLILTSSKWSNSNHMSLKGQDICDALIASLRSSPYLVALIHLHNVPDNIHKSEIGGVMPGWKFSAFRIKLRFLNLISPFIFIIYCLVSMMNSFSSLPQEMKLCNFLAIFLFFSDLLNNISSPSSW